MTLTTFFLMWFVMGVICFLLEMVLPGFVIFFFGVGAWVTALVCWLYPITLNWQLAIFLSSSLLSLLLLRKVIRKIFIGDVEQEDQLSDAVGESVEVVEEIVPPGEGKVFYSGTQWKAKADEKIEKGAFVTIKAQDGLILKVAKVSK